MKYICLGFLFFFLIVVEIMCLVIVLLLFIIGVDSFCNIYNKLLRLDVIFKVNYIIKEIKS